VCSQKRTPCDVLGGTLTGERGVEILKKSWIEQELGTAQSDLQKTSKKSSIPWVL
jgi:hypothetical protein